jgi:uncharacterized protein (UPF0332 family)
MSHSDEILVNLARANSSLQAAQVLFKAELFDDSASRSYYAVFHAASALLLSRNLSFNSHTGVLRAINLQFIKTGELPPQLGKEISWLAELRQIGDYGELNHVTPEAAKLAIDRAESFFNQVNSLLQLS